MVFYYQNKGQTGSRYIDFWLSRGSFPSFSAFRWVLSRPKIPHRFTGLPEQLTKITGENQLIRRSGENHTSKKEPNQISKQKNLSKGQVGFAQEANHKN